MVIIFTKRCLSIQNVILLHVAIRAIHTKGEIPAQNYNALKTKDEHINEFT